MDTNHNLRSMVRAKKLFRLVSWLYGVKKLEAGLRSEFLATEV